MAKRRVLLVLILLLSAYFRFQNITWDSGFHLHPDERFLTMVGNAMKMPQSVGLYLDPAVSPFNPVNVGHSFFVYGVFPVVLNKMAAIVFGNDTYELFTLQGRVFAGMADMLVVFLVFLTVRMLEERHKLSPTLKYWAAFLYGISVLPIQLSHFFAADPFLNLFMFASFYFSLKFRYFRNYRDTAFCALMLGLAVATKANAVFMLPLCLVFLGAGFWKRRNIGELTSVFLVFFSVLYFTVRLADPYYFQSPDLFDPTPNRAFVDNIRMLKSFEGKDVAYPPSIQWINTKPVLFSAFNLALFGLGLVQFFLLALGFSATLRMKRWDLRIIAGWVFVIFLYQSTQFVKVLRYFIFLYPFYAVFAAVGVERVLAVAKKRRLYGPSVPAILIGLCLIWPIAFTSIYLVPHTRVQASRWLNEHARNGALIVSEYWDDHLPLYSDPALGKQFDALQIPVFDPDSSAKWGNISRDLKRADYYVLSSNRGWGSMPAVSERYPETTRFYNELFAGKRGFTKVASFYPAYYPCRIMGNDCPRLLSDWFDESFTVYDHPTVHIFRNNEKTD